METLSILLANTKFLDLQVFNGEDLLELLLRFAFVTFINIIVIRYLYYESTRRKDFLFTFFLMFYFISPYPMHPFRTKYNIDIVENRIKK